MKEKKIDCRLLVYTDVNSEKFLFPLCPCQKFVESSIIRLPSRVCERKTLSGRRILITFFDFAFKWKSTYFSSTKTPCVLRLPNDPDRWISWITLETCRNWGYTIWDWYQRSSKNEQIFCNIYFWRFYLIWFLLQRLNSWLVREYKWLYTYQIDFFIPMPMIHV